MSDNEKFVRSIENATYEMIQELVKNMGKVCLIVEADAKKECPVDQGILRASMFTNVSTKPDNIVGTIANSAGTAPYKHEGTGIYAIDGNGRKTPWVYKAEVGKYKGWHTTKGQKPNPFLQRARDKNKDKISSILGGG